MKLVKGEFLDLRRTADGGLTRSSQPAYLTQGLALHRRQFGWIISHVASGYKLLDVIGKKDLALRVLASLLENYADWETAAWGFEPDPVAPPEVYRAVQIAARVMFPDLPPVA